MRNTLIALTTATVVAVLGGCSTQDPGRATTAPPPTNNTGTSSEETSSSGSPSGPDLNYDKFIGNECSILKADQLSQFGKFKEPKTDKTAAGPFCRWPSFESGPAYRVSFVTNGATIDDIKKNTKNDPVYRELQIEGYPATSSDPAGPTQNCGTSVGVSQKGVITVQISIDKESAPEFSKPCDYTEKLAAVVVGNLRG